MTIENVLTDYWSQTTLILLGLGFLIKRILDIRARKVEINHNLFQQKRLETVSAFFTNYARAEQMWTSIAVYAILQNKLKAKEIDEIIFPHINELKRNVLELQIYFKEEDHKYFEQIMDNIFEINKELKRQYFDFNSETSVTTKSNEFQFLRDEKLKENEVLFKRISTILRAAFK